MNTSALLSFILLLYFCFSRFYKLIILKGISTGFVSFVSHLSIVAYE